MVIVLYDVDPQSLERSLDALQVLSDLLLIALLPGREQMVLQVGGQKVKGVGALARR